MKLKDVVGRLQKKSINESNNPCEFRIRQIDLSISRNNEAIEKYNDRNDILKKHRDDLKNKLKMIKSNQ